MIRFIIETISFTPEGSVIGRTFNTLDVDLPKLEELLEDRNTYGAVTLIGAEVLK